MMNYNKWKQSFYFFLQKACKKACKRRANGNYFYKKCPKKNPRKCSNEHLLKTSLTYCQRFDTIASALI